MIICCEKIKVIFFQCYKMPIKMLHRMCNYGFGYLKNNEKNINSSFQIN
jgi:hypothetical protein